MGTVSGRGGHQNHGQQPRGGWWGQRSAKLGWLPSSLTALPQGGQFGAGAWWLPGQKLGGGDTQPWVPDGSPNWRVSRG